MEQALSVKDRMEDKILMLKSVKPLKGDVFYTFSKALGTKLVCYLFKY